MNRRERLVLNVLYVLSAKIALLALGLVTIPFVVHRLGVEAYGLYALVGVLVGYLSFLDLGTGQALVKHLTEALVHDDELGVQRLVETAATIFAVSGLVGAVLVGGLADVFVHRVMHVEPAFAETARLTLRLAGVGFAVTMAQNGLLAVPQACQRLDLVAKLTTVLGLVGLLVPVGLLALGAGLPSIVAAGILINIAGVVVLVRAFGRLLPGSALRFGLHRSEARRLFRFGGATLVGTLAAQVSLQIDKLIIGALLPLARVSYYAVPFNLAAKLHVVPYALGPVLFPAVSEVAARGFLQQLTELYLRTTKVLCATTLPLAVFLTVYSDRILEHWLGPDFAAEGALSLRLLTSAFFVMLMTQPATDVARGTGRPEIGAGIAACDAAVVAALCMILVPRLGIDGAALAILVGTGIGSVVFVFVVQVWILKVTARELLASLLRPTLASAVYAAILCGLRPAATGLLPLAVIATVALGAYTVATFAFVLDDGERAALVGASASLLRSS